MPRLIKNLKIALDVLDEHKAIDVEYIDVREKTPFADYYVFASANSNRQLNALKEILLDEFEKNKIAINHVEGKSESGWILIDAYNVIINIFSYEERERIALEKFLSTNK